jgi:hypothetical protein
MSFRLERSGMEYLIPGLLVARKTGGRFLRAAPLRSALVPMTIGGRLFVRRFFVSFRPERSGVEESPSGLHGSPQGRGEIPPLRSTAFRYGTNDKLVKHLHISHIQIELKFVAIRSIANPMCPLGLTKRSVHPLCLADRSRGRSASVGRCGAEASPRRLAKTLRRSLHSASLRSG